MKNKRNINLAIFLSVLTIIVGWLAYSSIKKSTIDQEVEFDKPEGFYDFYKQITTSIGSKNSSYGSNYAYFELNKARKGISSKKMAKAEFDWIQRGPGNVGGRTREVIVDPDDPTHKTWFAATASGGAWKTNDGGENWENLTPDLSFLATNALTMSPSNHAIFYLGTGEGYGGEGMVRGGGIYKSTDKGKTWNLLLSTINNENFRWVNKIVVDNTNADIVIAATNKGIFKTFDGGKNWSKVYFKGYQIQDLAVNPKNQKTIYATARLFGILKTYNNGDTWFEASKGIGTGGRFSVTVSPVDTNYIFTSVEGKGSQTHIYMSVDGANSWRKLFDKDNSFQNFLGPQGWFNNVIEAHPFDKNVVFIGGVNLGKVEFGNALVADEKEIMRVDTFGTAPFMYFVNFGGSYLGGGMSTGLDEKAEVEKDDYVSVELRFGPGIKQFAHRFTVPEGEGAGVPSEDYTYNNYINVPFQAWDTENNRQLMISFRDQDRNGEFNLIDRQYNDDINGREYIFIHAREYTATPDAEIAKNGGHFQKMLYFIWPALPEDSTWNKALLPNARIAIQYGSFDRQYATTTVLADNTRNEDLHVDHHDIDIVVTDAVKKEFMAVDANDGGLGVSYDQGLTWKQIKKNYQTTQFYGIAKKSGAHEYIGGMQDNGTWQSPAGVPSSKNSEYEFRVEGDGFEALWHPKYPQRILGSSYNNYIRISLDGGIKWQAATEGMQGDGPFITRLSNSPENPNLVFAVGDRGVYRHTNFCLGRFGWEMVDLGKGWAINDAVTSSHNVKVSLAKPSVVWAGAGMYRNPDLKMFRSGDYGKTFDTTAFYSGREMGYLTSIVTHPKDTATAYLLFSMEGKPKILRTQNSGNSWNDISGFGTKDSSSNGFPDVMVYSLLVFPDDTNRIWAGTEIGIFESVNNGLNWHFANMGFPAVSVWQMFIQDNTLVVATHGRGIWTTWIGPVSIKGQKLEEELSLNIFPNPAHDMVTVTLNSDDFGPVSVKIYDLSARILYSGIHHKQGAEFNSQIQLNKFIAGAYILSAQIAGKNYLEKLVVK